MQPILVRSDMVFVRSKATRLQLAYNLLLPEQPESGSSKAASQSIFCPEADNKHTVVAGFLSLLRALKVIEQRAGWKRTTSRPGKIHGDGEPIHNCGHPSNQTTNRSQPDETCPEW